MTTIPQRLRELIEILANGGSEHDVPAIPEAERQALIREVTELLGDLEILRRDGV